MKTIGLLGGMSWESTATYYKIINETIQSELGGLHSAKCLLYSVDFDPIEKYQANGEWHKCAEILSAAAKNLEKAGADFIVICSNTTHKVAPAIKNAVNIPLLHIAEMTALELKKNGISKIGLLGTKYTLKQDFYKDILISNNIEVIIPNDNDVEIVNSIIFEELCLGITTESSKKELLRIIDILKKQEIKGIILGCTELGLLINQNHIDIPIFDTALIHAKSAALEAIK